MNEYLSAQERLKTRGEEWWRVAEPLHLAKRPIYRGLQGMGEEWRLLQQVLYLYVQDNYFLPRFLAFQPSYACFP